MIKDGRTMREAIDAGNAFQLDGPNGFNYFPPAAETSEEVLTWAIARFSPLRPGKYAMRRITGGSIGCLFMETAYYFEVRG